MTYQETTQYLFEKLPMFTRIGAAAYKANLDNITKICTQLGNPQNQFKSIHVGGTNGKGSTSHMLSSVLQTAGYKVGLLTSPHIHDFRERIKINGKEVPEQWVIDFVEKTNTIIESEQPSFFEITTAMAFAYFAEQQIDIAIIEVGIGGLLDSTNIITPLLSIITNISKDHTQFLGTSLQSIAINKAGIIKPNIPVILSESNDKIFKIFKDTATANNSMLVCADRIITVKSERKTNAQLQNIVVIKHYLTKHLHYSLDLLGSYQLKNIMPVLIAFELLEKNGFNISEANIVDGLKNVKLNTGIKGRFDVVQSHPIIIHDVAHNEAGISQVMEQIKSFSFAQLHIVLGFVADKDIDNVLALFPSHAIYYFTKAQIPRALNEIELQQKASLHQLIGTTYSFAKDAYATAQKNATKQDCILVVGSFFTLAEII